MVVTGNIVLPISLVLLLLVIDGNVVEVGIAVVAMTVPEVTVVTGHKGSPNKTHSNPDIFQVYE